MVRSEKGPNWTLRDLWETGPSGNFLHFLHSLYRVRPKTILLTVYISILDLSVVLFFIS